jgi:hypothetical protein
MLQTTADLNRMLPADHTAKQLGNRRLGCRVFIDAQRASDCKVSYFLPRMMDFWRFQNLICKKTEQEIMFYKCFKIDEKKIFSLINFLHFPLSTAFSSLEN